MELINSTRMVAGYTMGLEPSGRELLVVVVKGTFGLPEDDGAVRLADEQVPLVLADVFHGEPGRSAPRHEADFVPRKQRCDILLDATAYAPGGRPTTRTQVSVSVGSWSKAFAIVGDRVWEAGATGIGMSPIIPFTTMPISYDRAFGGTDDKSDDPSQHAAFARNPSGRGFHKQLRGEWVDNSPLPNTEEDARPVTWVDGDYRPMSFGPIGRHWEPRYRYAGTYDDAWVEEHFPFLPPDFDERYYQSAPEDQQIPHPQGGEPIVLVNLTPSGRAAFVLPQFEAPVYFFPKRGPREDVNLVLDTVMIEPDRSRFTLTWRAARPLRKNIFEIAKVMVGKRSSAWWARRHTVQFPLELRPVPVENGQHPPDEPA
jgi:hypothetical protein